MNVSYWEPPPTEWMKFNVAGVVLEEVAECAGVSKEEKGVACALFLGRVEARGTDLSEIMAIKIAVDMYTEVSRKAHVPLIIKSCSIAASKWLSKRYYRLWPLRKLLGDINCGTKQLAHFQIAVIDRKSNGMVDALANASTSRSSLFRASW
ncbi:hypothetical protein ES288_D10G299200v1 [Gossypium darwinii]|uniref:RNase H type-1 domain-containing protein n=1 Tax=Gossypium darwinii TaxID=34276 RepID=A0A5D2B727_GOSDA|nr:hypothetical protein ES288_D10G299200v1 [Gossypium darwinii]